MADRTLKVEIIGDASSLQNAFGKATSGSGRLGSSLKTLGKIAAVGVGAAFAGFAATLKVGFDELSESQQVMKQTQAALKSTGAAAKVTAKDITDLAQAQSRLTGIDDEAVQAGENMLLTFTKIRNEVGKGNDIFNQATVAIEDMATRMNDGAIPSGEQLSQTAIRIGKALNDPIKGMGALSRVGVQFDESQKKAITSMVKAGDTMGAQKFILAELTKEFGGSAKAAGETLPGQLARLRNSFDEVAGQIAGAFLPTLTGALEGVSGFLGKLSEAKGFRAKLSVVWEGIEGMARSLWEKIVSAVQAIDWSAVAQGIQSGISRAFAALSNLWSAITRAFDAIDWKAIGQVLSIGFQRALAFLGSIDFAGIFAGVASRIYNALIALINSIDWGAVGQAIGQFVTDALNKIADFVERTDWNKVGQQLVEGFKAALKAFAIFLAGVDWLAVLGATFRAAVAVIRGLFSLFLGIMQELGLTMLRGLAQGLVALGSVLGQQLAKIPSALRSVAGQAPGWAAAIGLAILKGIGLGLVNLLPLLATQLGKVATAIINVAGQVPGWAAAIGRGIIDGIISGLSGLFERVKNAITGAISSAIDSVKGFFGIGSPSKVTQEEIGKPLGAGVIAGAAAALIPLAEEMKEKLEAAIAEAKQAVTAARGDFVSAFQSLASEALSAFDSAMSQWKPAAQIRLDKLQAKEQLAQLKADVAAGVAGVAEANRGLTEALSGGDPEAIKAAQEAVTAAQEQALAAQRALRDRNLAEDARKQQEAHDKQVARERIQFERQLANLQAAYGSQEITTRQFHQRLNKLMAQHGVDQEFYGTAAGISFANGIAKATNAVVAAFTKLLKRLERLGKLRSNAEEGPLSDLDVWWSSLGATLASGIDYENAYAGGRKLATSLRSGWDEHFANLPIGLGQDILDSIAGVALTPTAPTVEGDLGATLAAASVSSETLAGTLNTTLTPATLMLRDVLREIQGLWQWFGGAGIALWKKAAKELPPLIVAITNPFEALRGVLVGIRNAMKDIIDKAKEFAHAMSIVMGAGGPGIPGRQRGGRVRRGQPYIVGEAGPELFVPQASGTIQTAGANVALAGGGGSVTNYFSFPNYVGSKEELVDMVRRGLYDIARRNPGTGL